MLSIQVPHDVDRSPAGVYYITEALIEYKYVKVDSRVFIARVWHA